MVPDHVPIVRLVDPQMSKQKREWVLYAVLRVHREMPLFEAQQRDGVWKQRPNPDTSKTMIGILGIGELGELAGKALAGLDFKVMGWSRSPKEIEGIDCRHGAKGLDEVLAASNIIVCLLPLTDETRGILDAKAFARMPKGASVVNAARGAHIVDEDLIAALDTGHLAFAMMDVFHTEPLPADHPFWSHPKVTITPHVASLTPPASSAPQIAENVRRMRAGEPLLNVVERSRGY